MTTVLTGDFDTKSERVDQDTEDVTDLILKQNFPQGSYTDYPNVVIALNRFELGGYRFKTIALGVKAATERIERDCFHARLSIWGDGEMTSSGCSWMAYDEEDARFRSGTFRTSSHTKIPWEFPIKFKTAFKDSDNPTVLVWISGFQMGTPDTWELNASATNVDTSGFTLKVTKGENTTLYQGLFSWLAFTPGGEVSGGRGGDIGVGGEAGAAAPGGGWVWPGPEAVPFGEEPQLVTTDKVMVGISAFRLDRDPLRPPPDPRRPRCPPHDRMSLYYDPVEINNDKKGMEIKLVSRPGTTVHSATISWVAVA